MIFLLDKSLRILMIVLKYAVKKLHVNVELNMNIFSRLFVVKFGPRARLLQ